MKSQDTSINLEGYSYFLYKVVLSFLICNNVTPIEDEKGRILQAASPDEVSLVTFAEQMGFLLKNRDLFSIEIVTPEGKTLVYKIIKNFPFSSERKVIIYTIYN